MKILFIMMATLFFISGCSINENTNESDERKAPYDGQLLNIGVIGEKPSKSFGNITFHSAEPDSLKQEEYDAYFITEQYFEDLSHEGWKSVFMSINTPVFFLNIDVQPFIYRTEGMKYEETSPKATEHTSGFVITEDMIKMWGYGNPMDLTDVNRTPEWIFNSIFRDIEEHLKHENSINQLINNQSLLTLTGDYHNQYI
ncbi:hypothetical protein [Desertibacillus haloalkaliphilus]|uniref:hypothetical protein n=1 Tax=Desertibacillus haloalkaliphilus TaxID=1328930 RepID=UPI001C251A6B|nr:hypothetical protein [Desertibacillus haloalkaliphilus]MBU8907473.1 hypothetical protein [Desertibacillus haloalkaliphilus]